MTLAEQLRQTSAYQQAQSDLQKRQNKLRAYLAEYFAENPTWSQVFYFGKWGTGENYGMEQDAFASFVRSEGFRVEYKTNGYGVPYLRITLD